MKLQKHLLLFVMILVISCKDHSLLKNKIISKFGKIFKDLPFICFDIMEDQDGKLYIIESNSSWLKSGWCGFSFVLCW